VNNRFLSARMLFVAVPLLLSTGFSAYAAPVTFNFNTLAAGANDATVQSYMQGVLNSIYGTGTGKVTVTVTGALGDSGAVQTGAGLSWTGDGHVVGGTIGKPPSITLGNSNACSGSGCTAGSPDSYIRNNSLGLSLDPVSNIIDMTFTGAAFTGFTNAAFDWEIFPDGTCPALGNCGGTGNPNTPDLIFKAGAATVTTLLAVAPGTPGTYTNSPGFGSYPGGTEAAPQAIGTGSWGFASASHFQFQDWPSTIGIDNLTFTPPSSVPEPASVILLLTTALGCYFVGRKRQKA